MSCAYCPQAATFQCNNCGLGTCNVCGGERRIHSSRTVGNTTYHTTRVVHECHLCKQFRKLVEDTWMIDMCPPVTVCFITAGVIFCPLVMMTGPTEEKVDAKVKEFNETVDPPVPIKYIAPRRGLIHWECTYIIYPQAMLREGYVPGGGRDGIPPPPSQRGGGYVPPTQEMGDEPMPVGENVPQAQAGYAVQGQAPQSPPPDPQTQVVAQAPETQVPGAVHSNPAMDKVVSVAE